MLARLRRLAQMSAAGLLIVGLILRITVRDEIDRLAIVFYTTPWPVLAILGFVAAALWVPRKRFALAFLVTDLICAVVWIVESWERNLQSTDKQDLRVVSWNAEHPRSKLQEAIETARKFDADILGITETESTEPADAELWRAAFPGHTVQTLPGFMLLITRGEVLGRLSGSLGGGGNFKLVQLKFGERRLQLVFVEFSSNPMQSRRLAHDALRSVLSNLPNEPVVVMGDFNTPRESAHFGRLRENLQDAFDVRGYGFAETWPVPVPVLSLDHIFASQSLRVLRCKHGCELSDHRPVIADLAWIK
jgi:vancomycin resistance protein VanJ